MATKKKVNFSPFFQNFEFFFNSNNNFAMREDETIEGYILKAHIKFEVNRLNRTRDFMSTRLKKVVSRKTRLKFLFFFFYANIFL